MFFCESVKFSFQFLIEHKFLQWTNYFIGDQNSQNFILQYNKHTLYEVLFRITEIFLPEHVWKHACVGWGGLLQSLDINNLPSITTPTKMMAPHTGNRNRWEHLDKNQQLIFQEWVHMHARNTFLHIWIYIHTNLWPSG